MKDHAIDALISSAQPTPTSHSAFTKKVMQAITSTPHRSHTSWRQLFSLRRQLSFASIAALLISALLVSGAAYATYKLWLAPAVTLEETRENDRGNREFLFSLDNCDSVAGYEATEAISDDEAEKMIQARCERLAVDQWASTKWKKHETHSTLSVHNTSTFSHFDGNTAYFTDGYIKEASLTDDTLFLTEGQVAGRDDINYGDTVLLVQKLYYDEDYGHPIDRDTLALVKVNMPREYYDLSNEAKLRQQHSCMGTDELCVDHPMIDVYRSDTPGDAVLQAKIIDIQGELLTLEARSGTIYTLELPRHIIDTFNNERAPQHFPGHAIEIGRYIDMAFTKNPEAPTEILFKDISILYIFTNSSNPKKYL